MNWDFGSGRGGSYEGEQMDSPLSEVLVEFEGMGSRPISLVNARAIPTSWRVVLWVGWASTAGGHPELLRMALAHQPQDGSPPWLHNLTFQNECLLRINTGVKLLI